MKKIKKFNLDSWPIDLQDGFSDSESAVVPDDQEHVQRVEDAIIAE